MTGLRRRTFSGLTPFAAVLIAGVSFAARHVEAQSYRVLAEFEAQTTYREGLILGLDGRLYGTSFMGGPRGPFAWGTVFSMDTDGDNYTVLHAFEGSGHDRHPSSPLIQTPDGSLYGTAGWNGAMGAIFRIDPQGQYTVLHAFSYSPAPTGGSRPSGLTLASDGLLYGATEGAGGGVFRISTDGSDFTVIHEGISIGCHPGLRRPPLRRDGRRPLPARPRRRQLRGDPHLPHVGWAVRPDRGLGRSTGCPVRAAITAT